MMLSLLFMLALEPSDLVGTWHGTLYLPDSKPPMSFVFSEEAGELRCKIYVHGESKSMVRKGVCKLNGDKLTINVPTLTDKPFFDGKVNGDLFVGTVRRGGYYKSSKNPFRFERGEPLPKDIIATPAVLKQ